MGSIPAPAGEPIYRKNGFALSGVYPRACGGTHSQHRWVNAVLGLSPRLRGNLARYQGGAGAYGSIPAPAGEPHPSQMANQL